MRKVDINRDEGLSLTEVIIAVFLMVMVGVVFLPSMISGMRATGQISNAARANDDARLVLQRLDRELRGAELICSPAPGDPPGDDLRFLTRATTSSTIPASATDVRYRLAGATLEKSSDGGTTWFPVIEGVVNPSVVDDDYNLLVGRPAGTAGVPLFTNEQDGGYPSYGKVITVRVWVDESPTDHISPLLLTTEISGRNVWTPNGPGC